MALHGPHHSAKQSTRTGVEPSMSSLKFAINKKHSKLHARSGFSGNKADLLAVGHRLGAVHEKAGANTHGFDLADGLFRPTGLIGVDIADVHRMYRAGEIRHDLFVDIWILLGIIAQQNILAVRV